MKSIQELEAIRKETLENINLRKYHHGTRIVVGMATCGIAAGARNVLMAFMDEIGERELISVAVTQMGCIGLCRLEPIVEIDIPEHDKVTYVKVTPDMARRIIEEHIVGGKVIDEYTIDHYEAQHK